MELVRRAAETPMERLVSWADINLPPGVTLRKMGIGEQSILMESRMPKGFKTPPHTHNHESILYLLEGQIRCTIESETFDLAQGDAALHPEGSLHWLEALTDARWVEFKTTSRDVWITEQT